MAFRTVIEEELLVGYAPLLWDRTLVFALTCRTLGV
jgi:hypothetical protein